MRLPIIIALSSLAFGCGGETTPEDGGGMDAAVDGGGGTLCASDSMCDNDRFCDGVERCVPGVPGAGPNGCVAGTAPCSAGTMCEEETDTCSACSAADADGDGSDSIACGGADCDDEDSNRYPGNEEYCDADGHDEDCDDTTFGGLDADSDGFIDAECCNVSYGACGTDCDDRRRDVHPGAVEQCNAIDDDCDGLVDGIGSFCPDGTCVDQRCRASSWLRTIGSSSYDGPAQIVTDSRGNVFVTVTVGGPAMVGPDSLEAGAHLISYAVDGRYRWSQSAMSTWMVLDPSTIENRLALIDIGGVAVISAADAGLLTSWRHAAPEGASGEVSLLFARGDYLPRGELFLAGRLVDPPGFLVRRTDWVGVTLAERVLPAADLYALDARDDGSVLVALRATSELDVGLGSGVGPGTVIVRLSADMSTEWAVTLPEATRVNDVSFDLGGAIAVGSFQADVALPWGESWAWAGGDDAFAVMLESADGAHRWSKTHGSRGRDEFEFARFDRRGGVVVAGRFSGTFDAGIGLWVVDGFMDGFHLTLSVIDGLAVDGRRFTGPGGEALEALAVDSFGAVLAGGVFTGTATLGGFATTSRGTYDIFISRVSD